MHTIARKTIVLAVVAGLVFAVSGGIFAVAHAAQPVATTKDAINLTSNSATITGTVNPGNESTQYRFEYGTSNSLGTVTPWLSLGAGSTDVTVSFDLTGLTYNTTYYYRIVAQNGSGTSLGSTRNFKPQVNGGATFRITPTSQTLTAGQFATFAAYYDPDGSGGQAEQLVTSQASWSTSNTSIAYYQGNGQIRGLSPGTVTVAADYNNMSASASLTIVGQGGQGVALTETATNITSNAATLNGEANPNGIVTTVYFEFGRTPYFGQSVGNQTLGANTFTSYVSGQAVGLLPNTTYYYRLVVQNSYGTSYGGTLSFTTSGGGIPGSGSYGTPYAQTQTATNVTENSAMLSGFVNFSGYQGYQYDGYNPYNYNGYNYNYNYGYDPYSYNYNYNYNYNYGSPYGWSYPYDTTAYFEYGTTQYFGQTVNAALPTGGTGGYVQATIYGLTPGATYYYRLVARNSYGTNYGNTMTFTTTGVGSGYYYQPGYPYGSGYGTKPSATTSDASGIGQTSALLNGSVNAQGSATTYWFEYGRTTSLGGETTRQSAGSAVAAVPVATALAGLAANTTYYVRLAAQNSYGTSYGSTVSFRTSAVSGGGSAAYVPPASNAGSGSTAGGGTTPTSTPTSTVPAGTAALTLSSAFLDTDGNTVTQTAVVPGSALTWELTFKNTGTGGAENVMLTAILPPDAELVSAAPAAAQTPAGRAIFNFGAVAPGVELVTDLKITVRSSVAENAPLAFAATAEYADMAGTPHSASANATLQARRAGAASAAAEGPGMIAAVAQNVIGSSLTTWLLIILAVIVLGYLILRLVRSKSGAADPDFAMNYPLITPDRGMERDERPGVRRSGPAIVKYPPREKRNVYTHRPAPERGNAAPPSEIFDENGETRLEGLTGSQQ